MKKLLCVFVLSCLTACQTKTVILPNAYLKQPYHHEISIKGGSIYRDMLSIKTNFAKDTNLKVYPSQNVRYDNTIIISGVPETLGKYQISISGGFYGGGDFDKVYELNIAK